MTTHSMTHEQFEALLPAWMEGELRGEERTAFSAHVESCAQCGALVRDLEQIVTQARSLGPIEPPRELWDGIETRIGATVIPLVSRRRVVPLVRALVAAAVLVAVTAGITWKLAQRTTATVAPENVASAQPQPAAANAADTSSHSGLKSPVINAPPQLAPPTPVRVAKGSDNQGDSKGPQRPVERASSTEYRAVSNGARLQDEDKIYDREINRLRTVLKTRKSDLDPRTVLAIEKSLAVIDTAIAQARSALAADPASRFLEGQLTKTLDKKVELLRTAALLPSRS